MIGQQNKFGATSHLNVSFTDVLIESSSESYSENDQVPPLPQVGPRALSSTNNNMRLRPGWVPSVGPSPNNYLNHPLRSTENKKFQKIEKFVDFCSKFICELLVYFEST